MNVSLDILSYENPVLRSYIFWSSILVIKMVLMGPLTALQRLKRKVSVIIGMYYMLVTVSFLHLKGTCKFRRSPSQED